MLDFQQIVKAFQSVHSPAYGQSIAGTNAVAQGTGQGSALATSNSNEVYRIDSIFLANTGGAAPITAILKLGDAPINSTMDSMNNAVLQPAGNAITMGPFFMDSNTPLTVAVTAGSEADLEWFVKYSMVGQ